MMRWLMLPALAVLLSGCVADSGYRSSYDDGYYVGDSYGEPVYAGGSSYYAPADDGRGDYYYGNDGYSNYVDNPFYYSLFWPLNRWSVDPYRHPGFFYGVTYYPRSYFSLGFSSGHGYRYGGGYSGHYRPWGYGNFAYSPYRLSWVDSYYDWPSYRSSHSRRDYTFYAPRYGNARNEADWLSRQARSDGRYSNDSRRYGSSASGLPRTQSYRSGDRSREALDARREAARGADYGSRTRGRADPAVSGFGYRSDAQIKRPSELRDPAGRVRGDRGGSTDGGSTNGRSEASRYRAGPASEGSSRSRYIGESGDVRNVERSSVRSGEPARSSRSAQRSTVPSYSDSRSQRVDAPSAGIRYRPETRSSDAETRGYRVAPSRSSAPTYRSQSEPPVYRSAEPRAQQRSADVQRGASARTYEPQSRPQAPVYRQPESRSASPAQYRSVAPARSESPRYESAPRQSYAPRESYEPRDQPARAAEQRSSPPARTESDRGDVRSERRRSRDEPENDPA
jgi:hypothetical protein